MAALSFKLSADTLYKTHPRLCNSLWKTDTDTGCLPSTHTLPPGARHAPGHNVKFHMAELPGRAIIGPHA